MIFCCLNLFMGCTSSKLISIQEVTDNYKNNKHLYIVTPSLEYYELSNYKFTVDYLEGDIKYNLHNFRDAILVYISTEN
jgi:hypothetical protein